jgi:hypothetical protein
MESADRLGGAFRQINPESAMTTVSATDPIRLPTQGRTTLEHALAEIDARHVGQGGGLRHPQSVTDPRKQAIVERLRAKHVNAIRS